MCVCEGVGEGGRGCVCVCVRVRETESEHKRYFVCTHVKVQKHNNYTRSLCTYAHVYIYKTEQSTANAVQSTPSPVCRDLMTLPVRGAFQAIYSYSIIMGLLVAVHCQLPCSQITSPPGEVTLKDSTECLAIL